MLHSLAVAGAHHLSYLTGGIVILALAPVWYFVFYAIIEYATKKIGNPYRFSTFQKIAPVAFLIILGLALTIRGA
jgi:hypothetical protein